MFIFTVPTQHLKVVNKLTVHHMSLNIKTKRPAAYVPIYSAYPAPQSGEQTYCTSHVTEHKDEETSGLCSLHFSHSWLHNNNSVHLSCAHDTLSAHIIHINLNTIFYMYIEDSPIKAIHIWHYVVAGELCKLARVTGP